VVFDNWDWDHEEIHKVMREVTRSLQNAVKDTELRTVERRGDKWERWDIIRNRRYPSDYAVWKFFPEDCAKAVVRPMDRLMACWSHVALAQAESPDVLSSDMKRDKKDIEVVQRLRMLQATCITISQGNYCL
jgi:hypothetical protein